MFNSTVLDFSFQNTNTCNTLGIMDISYYNPTQSIIEPTLQVLVPGYSTPVELTYYKGGITILNSSNLNIKKANKKQLKTVLISFYHVCYKFQKNLNLKYSYSQYASIFAIKINQNPISLWKPYARKNLFCLWNWEI